MFHLLRIVVKNGRLVTFRKFSIMENLKKTSLAWKMKIKEILIEDNLEETSLVWKEKDRVDDFPLEKVSIAFRLFLFSKPGNFPSVKKLKLKETYCSVPNDDQLLHLQMFVSLTITHFIFCKENVSTEGRAVKKVQNEKEIGRIVKNEKLLGMR